MRRTINRLVSRLRGGPESEVAYVVELLRLNRRGMFVAGCVGMVAPLLLIGVRLLSGIAIGASDVPGQTMAIWDEAAIFAMGLVSVVCSRTQRGPEFGRLIVGVLLLFAASVIVLDDALRGGESAAPLYLALLTFVATAVVPFRPWQVGALGLAMALTHFALTSGVVPIPRNEPVRHALEHSFFLIFLSILATWMTAIAYHARLRHFQTLKSLRASEQKYRSIFEDSHEAIFVIDNATSCFKDVNPVMEKLLGMPLEEIRRTRIVDIVHPDERARVMAIHQARLRGEDAPVRYTTKISTRLSDEPRIADIAIHRQTDPGITAGVAHDITETVRAMETVRVYAGQLEETNRKLKETQLQLVQTAKMAALGDLVAGVAHELNSPLASIHSCLEVTGRAASLLHESIPHGEANAGTHERSRVERALQVLSDVSTTGREAAQRISEVVRTLRAFAHLDEAELKSVNLNASLDDTLRLLQHEVGPDVVIRRDFGQLPPIECYASQINQLFWNVLQNAARAVRGHGEISVTTRASDHSIETCIRDTGVGIPPDILGHIFDPSFVFKQGQVRMGLGLPIAYRIAEAHQGTIRIQSSVGEGTEVVVVLPDHQIRP